MRSLLALRYDRADGYNEPELSGENKELHDLTTSANKLNERIGIGHVIHNNTQTNNSPYSIRDGSHHFGLMDVRSVFSYQGRSVTYGRMQGLGQSHGQFCEHTW